MLPVHRLLVVIVAILSITFTSAPSFSQSRSPTSEVDDAVQGRRIREAIDGLEYEKALAAADDFVNALSTHREKAGMRYGDAISLKAYVLLLLSRLQEASPLFEE